MDNQRSSLTTLYLRNLLSDLTVQRSSVCIRFRLLGEMWKPNFMRVSRLTDRGLILVDESTKEFVFVSDLSDIVQFEIDDRFHDLQPHFHYEVIPKLRSYNS